MRIIDGRTEEGRKEIEIKRELKTLFSMVLLYDANIKPGQFIKRYKDRFVYLKDIKTEHINNRFPY